MPNQQKQALPSERDFKVTADDRYLFAKGEWYRAFEKMGAHRAQNAEGIAGCHFALWAPDVRSVHVITDFSDWDEHAHPLSCSEDGGIWQGFIADMPLGARYKYLIETHTGEKRYKADPYANYAEAPPYTASRVWGPNTLYTWHDQRWLAARKSQDMLGIPLNIFEVHLASWKRHADGLEGNGTEPQDPERAGGSYLSYAELADQLVSYVKSMGYTHIELLPVMEHPFDGSWGYQITGFYAPSARYGNPDEFKALIDACHRAKIGVILDWVPSGFCQDDHGLARFNGNMLYECKENPGWGTYRFDYKRGQVRSFLIANLLFWIEQFHIDGIRVDGVTSMLYLNFGTADPAARELNEHGGEEDLISIDFIRQCNQILGTYHPDVMKMAEESSAWPLVTYPPSDGGLGFNFKWDMGWMHDTLHYMQTDFPYRPGRHELLTFSTMYQYNENFVLSLSHDEVVHGKCSLITRMPGDWWRQFAGMRALALYQMTHMGAKLNFMGNEIAQFIEWRYYEGIEYFLTELYPTHKQFQTYTAALNALYAKLPGLWRHSYSPEGFFWLDADNRDESVIVYERLGDKPQETLVVVINFDVAAHEDYRIPVRTWGLYEEVFNSDEQRFGGSGVVNEGLLQTVDMQLCGQQQALALRVPPLGGCVLRRRRGCYRPKKKNVRK